MANHRLILGQRICTARKRLRLTQRQLAKRASLPAHQIVSQIEKGQRDVKAWELAALARVLRVQISELLGQPEPEEVPLVLWRQYPSEGRETMEADFLHRCQLYATLEKLSGEAIEGDLPVAGAASATMTYGQVKRLADEARKQFELGARPATSLAGTLEDVYGVKVWYKNLGVDGSAASTVGPFGYAVLMNSIEAPWRRNFSFAHELFHLLTWKSIPAEELTKNSQMRDKVESLANAFASALLLPTDPVVRAMAARTTNGVISYTDLIDIARLFDVSTDALLFRLLDLRLINQETIESLRSNPAFRASDRNTMRARWWDPPPMPRRFVRLAFAAFQKGRLSRARLAQYLDTSLVDLTETLLEYGLDDREDYETEVPTTGC